MGLESGAQITLDDATRRARTPDPRKIDVVFPSQATDDGRGPHPSARGPLRGRRAAFLVLGRLALAARWRLLALADDHGYRLAHRHSVALACDDLLEDAGVLGSELHGRLVGLDLGQDISDLYRVALAFQPRAEGSCLHRIAHLGHDHLGHLYFSSR